MKTFEEKLKDFAAATNNELYDADKGFEDWNIEAVRTSETLDAFKAASLDWRERIFAGEGEVAGLPFVSWRRVQALKGQPRRDVSVVDFGDRRIVLDADLTIF